MNVETKANTAGRSITEVYGINRTDTGDLFTDVTLTAPKSIQTHERQVAGDRVSSHERTGGDDKDETNRQIIIRLPQIEDEDGISLIRSPSKPFAETSQLKSKFSKRIGMTNNRLPIIPATTHPQIQPVAVCEVFNFSEGCIEQLKSLEPFSTISKSSTESRAASRRLRKKSNGSATLQPLELGTETPERCKRKLNHVFSTMKKYYENKPLLHPPLKARFHSQGQRSSDETSFPNKSQRDNHLNFKLDFDHRRRVEADIDDSQSKVATVGSGDSTPFIEERVEPKSDLEDLEGMDSGNEWPVEAERGGQKRKSALSNLVLTPGDPFVLPPLHNIVGSKVIGGLFQSTLTGSQIEETLRIYRKTNKLRQRQPLLGSYYREKKGDADSIQGISLIAKQKRVEIDRQEGKLPNIHPDKPASRNSKTLKEKSANKPSKPKISSQEPKKMFNEADYDQFSHRRVKKSDCISKRESVRLRSSSNSITKQYDRHIAMKYIKVKIGD